MLIERLTGPLTDAWSRLREAGGVGRGPAAELTEEELRSELADLGLLGRAFGPEEYRRALEERLGVEISIEEIPVEAEGTVLGGSVSGNMAE